MLCQITSRSTRLHPALESLPNSATAPDSKRRDSGLSRFSSKIETGAVLLLRLNAVNAFAKTILQDQSRHSEFQ